MKKTLALLMALTLVVTAIGVLTVAGDLDLEDVEEVDPDEVVRIEDSEDEDVDIVIKVIPAAFDGESFMTVAEGTDEVTVKVDPIHVS